MFKTTDRGAELLVYSQCRNTNVSATVASTCGRSVLGWCLMAESRLRMDCRPDGSRARRDRTRSRTLTRQNHYRTRDSQGLVAQRVTDVQHNAMGESSFFAKHKTGLGILVAIVALTPSWISMLVGAWWFFFQDPLEELSTKMVADHKLITNVVYDLHEDEPNARKHLRRLRAASTAPSGDHTSTVSAVESAPPTVAQRSGGASSAEVPFDVALSRGGVNLRGGGVIAIKKSESNGCTYEISMSGSQSREHRCLEPTESLEPEPNSTKWGLIVGATYEGNPIRRHGALYVGDNYCRWDLPAYLGMFFNDTCPEGDLAQLVASHSGVQF